MSFLDVDLTAVENLSIYELKNLARELGLEDASAFTKQVLQQKIVDLVMTGNVPVNALAQLVGISQGLHLYDYVMGLSVAEPLVGALDVAGFVHVMPSKHGMLVAGKSLYHIPSITMGEFGLGMGDFVNAQVAFDKGKGRNIVTKVLSVEWKAKDATTTRPFRKSDAGFKLGERVVVQTPKTFDRVEHILDVTKQIRNQHDVRVVVAALEEDTDYKNALRDICGEHVYISNIEMGQMQQVAALQTALFTAKRMFCEGADVVLFIDNVTKLYKTLNKAALGRTKRINFGAGTGEVMADANTLHTVVLDDLKRTLSHAKQIQGGASLTIVAYISNPQCSVEQYVLGEICDVANAIIVIE